MRKLSTCIGVYAILLIAAFYGSTSLLSLQGKTVPNAVVTIQKAGTSAEEKEQTIRQNFRLRKIDNLDGGYSLILQPNATADAGLKFFNHSATIQHYINTL